MAEDQPGAVVFKIVVVEDVPELATSIGEVMGQEGFEAHIAADAEAGLELVKRLEPDLVVLDVSLPGMDGIEACRQLRRFSDAYVIMLTARSSQADTLAGLSVGADDYMTKPFYPRELVARMRAMERRPRSSAATVGTRRFGRLSINPDTQRVKLGGQKVALSRIEFGLLNTLAVRSNQTISRGELFKTVWGESWLEGSHTVDVHISNLRQKLGDDPHEPRYIETIRGVGFRMGPG